MVLAAPYPPNWRLIITGLDQEKICEIYMENEWSNTKFTAKTI